MTDQIMMALGGFRFSVNTAAYQAFSRETVYRWESVSRASNRPALQWAGFGDDSITLEGVIYPHYRGGPDQLDRMRALAGLPVHGRDRRPEPLILVDGVGRVWGKWVIVRVGEKQSNHMNTGQPLKQEFTLELKFYGADPSAASS